MQATEPCCQERCPQHSLSAVGVTIIVQASQEDVVALEHVQASACIVNRKL